MCHYNKLQLLFIRQTIRFTLVHLALFFHEQLSGKIFCQLIMTQILLLHATQSLLCWQNQPSQLMHKCGASSRGKQTLYSITQINCVLHVHCTHTKATTNAWLGSMKYQPLGFMCHTREYLTSFSSCVNRSRPNHNGCKTNTLTCCQKKRANKNEEEKEEKLEELK